jgi:hypothetical protein
MYLDGEQFLACGVFPKSAIGHIDGICNRARDNFRQSDQRLLRLPAGLGSAFVS